MIKSFLIRNFQSHKHSKLEFSPGVNVIIGLPDMARPHFSEDSDGWQKTDRQAMSSEAIGRRKNPPK